MRYWIHRCKYQGGFEILDKENKLTIGFSDCANNEEMVNTIKRNAGKEFDDIYKEIYGGAIWRSRWSLWYFTCEMKTGDIVVVPRDGGFSVCRLIGEVSLSPLRDVKDIGFEWNVEKIVNNKGPRENYASNALLSRMKCYQTTADICDLADSVENAIKRVEENKPFSLPIELADKCYEMLGAKGYGSPDHFEQLLLAYFTKQGAKAKVLPKNNSDKVGDCDVEAVFPLLHLTISVQAKKHWGQTGDWAVQQIADYAENRKKSDNTDANWSYVNWVVSFAEEFTETAVQKAQMNGVVLINGKDFCKMLISAGLEV